MKSFHDQIYQYFRLNSRQFPWRQATDPYHILVSEIMLQQTQTERVEAKYDNFLVRFPDFAALAGAELNTTLSLWQGLGYNRRALSLKKTAETVMSDFGGELSDSRHNAHEDRIIRSRLFIRIGGFRSVPVHLVPAPVDAAGGAVFQSDEAAQTIVVLDEFAHHEHGHLQKLLAVVAEENVVILLASLRVAHQAHGRGFGARILDDPDLFSQKITHQLQGERKFCPRMCTLQYGLTRNWQMTIILLSFLLIPSVPS